MSFLIEWFDSEREPKCAPNPLFPDGKAIEIHDASQPHCTTLLPYPAKRCGMYEVVCQKCGYRIGITTAGRPDDPRSLTINCKLPTEPTPL